MVGLVYHPMYHDVCSSQGQNWSLDFHHEIQRFHTADMLPLVVLIFSTGTNAVMMQKRRIHGQVVMDGP